METWICDHPWWTTFITYSLAAIGAMLAVWWDNEIDEYGSPETSIGGYVVTYFLWWLPIAVAVLSWFPLSRAASQRKRHQSPPT